MDRPTVLLVGTGERMKAALEDALERHGLMVETVSLERASDAAFAAAPDLLVLIGDASLDGGRSVLARLAASPATGAIPVILLADEAGLDQRLDAFRHGVVAVVPKSASADGMARRVAEVARELPERPGETAGELGEATVDELVELFSQQLRTGILSVSAEGGDGASAQVVLRAGRPVAEAIEELVQRLRPVISAGSAGSLRYEFHESTSARLTLLDNEESEPGDTALLKGRRVLLIEQNPARADVLVQDLRAHGALCVVADGQGTGLERARAMDPEVVVIDGSGVQGWALKTLRTLRRDPRLRWASLLVVDAEELWPKRGEGPNLERLATSLKPLIRADHDLAERAVKEPAFDTRLDVVGPIRLLRALTDTGVGLRLSVRHPKARVEVDLAEGIVAGASAFTPAGEVLAEGPGAMATLIALGSGRVHVEQKEAPASANVMAPLDDALAAAAVEAAPIKPSVPPPASPSEPPKPSEPARAQDAERLMGRLEELLERLQKVLPPEAVEAKPATEAKPAIPRPGRGLPAPRVAKKSPPPRPRHKTMVMGSPRPAARRIDSQDDLPVIEATAEPGTAARGESPAAVVVGGASDLSTPAVEPPPSPAARPHPTPFQPAAPVEASPAARPHPTPFQPAAPVEASPEPRPHPTPFQPAATSDALRPNPTPPFQPAAPSEAARPNPTPPFGSSATGPASTPSPLVAPPAVAAAPFPSEPAIPQPPLEARRFDPATPTGAPAMPYDESSPRSRGPLFFLVAFVLTLFVFGGAAAAYLYLGRESDPPDDDVAPAEPTTEAPPPPVAAAAEDAGVDAGMDAGTDAGMDAGTDAGVDAGTDAGVDAGTDAGVDAGPGEGPEEGAEDDDGGDLAHIIRIANYQRNRGNLPEAERQYMRALSIDSNSARALAGLVRLNMARGSSSAAVRWARRLVSARPRNPNNHVLLGDTLERAGNHRAAVRSWRHALELDPNQRTARRRLRQ